MSSQAAGAERLLDESDEFIAGDCDFAIGTGDFLGHNGAAGFAGNFRFNAVTGAGIEQLVDFGARQDGGSAEQFSKFTAGQVGNQIAFVRGSTVVWGPKIGGPIDGQVLQLSGDLKPEQAKEIARMLRDDS